MDFKFNTIEPPANLQSVVRCFFTFEGNDDTYDICHFADTNAKLLFMKEGQIGFCPAYNLQNTDSPSGWTAKKSIEMHPSSHKTMLLGPCREYGLIKLEGKASIIGAELQPTGIWMLTGKSASLFADSLSAIGDCAALGISMAAGAICNATAEDAALAAISDFLANAARLKGKDSEGISQIHELINQPEALCSISGKAQNANISEKRQLRLFKKYIGIAPVSFFLIKRLKEILRQLIEADGSDSLTQIAEAQAFYDTSHLRKQAKRLIGHTIAEIKESIQSIKSLRNISLTADCCHLRVLNLFSC